MASAKPQRPTTRHRQKPKGAARARLRLTVFERDDYTCQDCGWRPAEIPEGYHGDAAIIGSAPALPPGRKPRSVDQEMGIRKLTLGHKIPYSKGGTYALSNLRTECSTCNYGKGARHLWPAATDACSRRSGTTKTSAPLPSAPN